MRRGRQVDKLWKVRKYKGDLALYAHCKCGFDYLLMVKTLNRSAKRLNRLMLLKKLLLEAQYFA